MSRIRIDLCANGKPMYLIPHDTVDMQQYTRTVAPTNQYDFDNAVMFFIGSAHGLWNNPAFGDVEFTISLNTTRAKADTSQVIERMHSASVTIRRILGDDAVAKCVEDLSFTVLKRVKH